LPVNLHTINQFFGKTMSPDEARRFVAGLGDQSISEPRNFEEQALKMLGRDLYETFFKGYTVKQWGCDPTELPAAILKRLPVRFNYDDNYYSKRFQGIPAAGYTEIVRRILDHPRIHVRLNKRLDVASKSIRADDGVKALEPCSTGVAHFAHVFYTGPLDAFFNYCEGRLGYRTVTFKRIDTDRCDLQGTAVINYPDLSVPWTRIHEHKHFAPWEQNERTVAFQEYSKETEPADIPYYPKRLAADKTLLRYRQLAEELASRTSIPGNQCARVSFLGRLATYRYMDMEAVISEALDFADSFIASIGSDNPPQVFPNAENA
jgi:UDP-galactopyranose mutase